MKIIINLPDKAGRDVMLHALLQVCVKMMSTNDVSGLIHHGGRRIGDWEVRTA